MLTASLLRTRVDFKNDINQWVINIIQKIIKLRRSIYRTEIISLSTSNKSKVYFKIRFLTSLTCLNLDRTVISPILIDLLSSEHSKTSLGNDSFPQLIGISIDSEWSKCVRNVLEESKTFVRYEIVSECSMFDGFCRVRNSKRTRKKYMYI